MQNLKEGWQNLPQKTRNLIKAIAGGTAVIALIAIVALNMGKETDYSLLFTGLNQEEAQQVVSLLQEQDIDYQYEDNDGSIHVPAATADQTRANLLSQGYPKSGFTYNMYLNNTGLMSTETDKKQVTLYELQDRLGAQIRLFDGVQDAKVTIALAGERRYVLDTADEYEQDASASVVVTMKNGYPLTSEKAQAVKGLIAHAVRGLNVTRTAVYDASTMMEVGTDGDSAIGGATDITNLTSMVENNIALNVRRVLEQLYGEGNVAVSVKGRLNMERLIQESTQYTTPDKIDEEDKTGLLQKEDLTDENSLSTNPGAGGLVGADANADIPRYTNDNGAGQGTDSYENNSSSRLWLYNMLKEQRQIDPGVLEDTSIGVVIITEDNTVEQESLLRLVANSSGIPVDQIDQKITIVRYAGKQGEEKPPIDIGGTEKPGDEEEVLSFWARLRAAVPLPILIAIGAGFLLLLLRAMRKKKNAVLTGDDLMLGEQPLGEDGLPLGEDGLPLDDGDREARMHRMPEEEEEDEFAKNEEILNLKMQRSLRLKQNISEFVDQNPQIAAKLVQTWLRGEDDGGTGKKKHGGRKQ